MKLSDYVANIPCHQKEGRSYSHVGHDDLRRWLDEIEDARRAALEFVECLDNYALLDGSYVLNDTAVEGLQLALEECPLWGELPRRACLESERKGDANNN